VRLVSVQRYKLTITYRGTRYHGWQTQQPSQHWTRLNPVTPANPDAPPAPPTVQQLITNALQHVVGHPVNLCGSSRTDSGVHAKGQVAHFDTPMIQIPQEGLRRAVNARLPDDILVRTIEPVSQAFHVAKNTIAKRYQYFVWNAPDRHVMLGDLAFHRSHKLNLNAMREAATYFVGDIDMHALSKPGHGRANTIRTVTECSVSARGPRVVIGVTGNGFLWNTVRIIAGTLVEIGIGRLPVSCVPTAIAARERQLAGPTAPPHGLYLHWIQFAPTTEHANNFDADE